MFLSRSRPSSFIRLFDSLCREPPLKALDAEWRNHRIDLAVEHQARDGVGGDRREQNAVAVMARRVDKAFDRRRPEDRCVIALPYSAARAGRKRSRPNGRIAGSTTLSRMSRAMASAVTGANKMPLR